MASQKGAFAFGAIIGGAVIGFAQFLGALDTIGKWFWPEYSSPKVEIRDPRIAVFDATEKPEKLIYFRLSIVVEKDGEDEAVNCLPYLVSESEPYIYGGLDGYEGLTSFVVEKWVNSVNVGLHFVLAAGETFQPVANPDKYAPSLELSCNGSVSNSVKLPLPGYAEAVQALYPPDPRSGYTRPISPPSLTAGAPG